MRKKKFLIMLPVILINFGVSAFLTFILTYFRHGFGEGFLYFWVVSFVPTFLISSPLGIGLSFILDKFVNFMFSSFNKISKKIVLGILTGSIMELVFSLISIITGGNYSNFFLTWMSIYIKALPFGICVGFLFAFIVKPFISSRVEKLKNLSISNA